MKYEVTFSCGHTSTVDLVGKGEDRKRKIKWYEDPYFTKIGGENYGKFK